MNVLLWLAFITVGFLSGSIMFCQIVPKLLTHKDVSKISDDHNPGAFNVFSHCGKAIGTLCLVLDVLKAFVPVLIAGLFLNTSNMAFALVISAPVFGHAVGAFNGFRGGKCIAASFGAMLGLIPVTFLGIIVLAGLYVFFAGVVRIKPNRKCSIIVYCCFFAVTAVLFNVLGLYSVALGCAVISVLATVKHINFNFGRNAGEINAD